MNTCVHCGHEIHNDDKYCPICGYKQIAKMINCQRCGASNNPNNKFCSSCGYNLKLPVEDKDINNVTDGILKKKSNDFKICSHCGHKINKDNKYCPLCGNKQVNKKIKCPVCGNENDYSFELCERCGANLKRVSSDKSYNVNDSNKDNDYKNAFSSNNEDGLNTHSNENELDFLLTKLKGYKKSLNNYKNSIFKATNISDNSVDQNLKKQSESFNDHKDTSINNVDLSNVEDKKGSVQNNKFIDVDIAAPTPESTVIWKDYSEERILTYKRKLGIYTGINNVLIGARAFATNMLIYSPGSFQSSKSDILLCEDSGIIILGMSKLGKFTSNNHFIPKNKIEKVTFSSGLFCKVVSIHHNGAVDKFYVWNNHLGSAFEKQNYLDAEYIFNKYNK